MAVVNDLYLNEDNCPEGDSSLLGLTPLDSYTVKDLDDLRFQAFQYIQSEVFRLTRVTAKEEALRGQTVAAYEGFRSLMNYYYLIDYLTLMYLKAQEYYEIYGGCENMQEQLSEEFNYEAIKKCVQCSSKINTNYLFDLFDPLAIFEGGINFMTILEDETDCNPLTIYS